MRRKATAKNASPRDADDGTATVSFKSRENTPSRSVKLAESKIPAGKGLGKAGAKRLGRMLKRAIQHQEEPTGKGKFFSPKTPVRLLKHQIETQAKNAPKTSSSKLVSPQVSKLILSLVSQCKNRAGISMAELKQTLAAEGYDVTKNNRQVNVVTKRLVGNGTLVRTTRNTSLRLNKIKMNSATHKPKPELKKSYEASKSSKGADRSQRCNKKSPKPRGKLQKTKGKTNTAATPKKQPVKTWKPAVKSPKTRRQTPKSKRKSPTPRWKNLRFAKSRAAQAHKPPKTKKTQTPQTKRDKHPYKSSQRHQLPKTTSKLKYRQTTRRKPFAGI